MIEKPQLEVSLESQDKHVYLADEISTMLQISRREAYHILNSTDKYKVIRFGRNIRADKSSFDAWFHGQEERGSNQTYTPEQVARLLHISVRAVRSRLKQGTTDFRVLMCGGQIIRIHKRSFDNWLGLTSS